MSKHLKSVFVIVGNFRARPAIDRARNYLVVAKLWFLALLVLLLVPLQLASAASTFDSAARRCTSGNMNGAARLWRELAERSDAKALYNLGVLGHPTWMEKSALLGNWRAKHWLGWDILNNAASAKEAEKGFRFLEEVEKIKEGSVFKAHTIKQELPSYIYRALFFPGDPSTLEDRMSGWFLEESLIFSISAPVPGLYLQNGGFAEGIDHCGAEPPQAIEASKSLSEGRLKELAILNSPTAQVLLGDRYRSQKGANFAHPMPEAYRDTVLRLYRTAAENSYPPAMHKLGLALIQDKPSEAVALMSQSANLGDFTAARNLIMLSAVDRRGIVSKAAAAELAREGAEAGSVELMASYSLLLRLGYGVTRNIKQSIHWMERAADQDYETAGQLLAMKYVTQGVEYNSAAPVLEELEAIASEGNEYVEYLLCDTALFGPNYMSEEWIRRLNNIDIWDRSGVIKHCGQSADRHDSYGLVAFAILEYSAEPPNIVQALKWGLLAADNASEAQGRGVEILIRKFTADMSPEDVAKANSLAEEYRLKHLQ